MFNNIGGTIKGFARFLTWVGIIASIIVGIELIKNDNNIGFLVIIVGILVSWMSSWILYAFGELVENSTIIAKHFGKPEQSSQDRNNNQGDGNDSNNNIDWLDIYNG